MAHPLQEFWVPGGWDANIESQTALPEQPQVAKGHDLPLPFGVDYAGPFETLHDGVNVSVRRNARALNDAGVPVFLQSSGHTMMVGGTRTTARFGDLADEVKAEVGDHRIARHRESLLKIRHVTLSGATVQLVVYPGNMQWADEDYVRRYRATTVVYTVFERLTPDEVLQDCAKSLNKIAQVWVPCTRNRAVLVASGMDPNKVHVVPHPFDPNEVPLFAKYHQARPKSQICRFFNVGKWEPRKAQNELIGAFLLAFSPNDPAQLVIKTSAFGTWKNYPRNVAHAAALWLEVPAIKARGWAMDTVQKQIRLYTEPLPREMLIAMHVQSDIYVACGRAEGFDLPAFDARMANRRLVYVPAGGSEDFAGDEDVMVSADQPYTKVHEQYGWGRSAQWSGYTVEELSAAMTKAFSEWRNHPYTPMSTGAYHPKLIGKKMRELCEAIIVSIRKDNPNAQR